MSEPSKITEQLIALLKSRDAFGHEKYKGTTLDRKDLTIEQWLQHQTEELLDGAGYAQAAIREITTLRAELAKVTAEWKEAFREAAKYAGEAGYATGKLKMSEAAGVVDGWMDRAKKAESAVARVTADQCGVVAEASRQVAASDSMYRKACSERDAALAQLATARPALTRLRDCDWVITLPDRMDGVREIAREALDAIDAAKEAK